MLHSPYRQLGNSTDTRSVIVAMATDNRMALIWTMTLGTSVSNINILLSASLGSCKAVGCSGDSAGCSPLAGQV